MKKWNKHLEILSFYTCVPWMTVIWCMVLEIWSATEIIFCHFRQFFALLPPNNLKNQTFDKNEKTTWRYYHFTHVYHRWQSYDVWFLRYWGRQTKFFVVLDHFLPFYHPKNPKKNKFWKNEKKCLEILPFYTSLP